MPTTDVTNTLIANITSTEQSTSNVDINRGTGNPAFNSNIGVFVTYMALGSGLNSLNSPINPTTQVYIRNLDTTKTITVTWTPNLGSAATIIILNPGDQIILWMNPGGTNPGVNNIGLTPSASGALVEYFLGG